MPPSDSDSDVDSLDDDLELRDGGSEKKPCAEVESSFKNVLARLAVERRHQKNSYASKKHNMRHGTDHPSRVYPNNKDDEAREYFEKQGPFVSSGVESELGLGLANADLGKEREDIIELKQVNKICNKQDHRAVSISIDQEESEESDLRNSTIQDERYTSQDTVHDNNKHVDKVGPPHSVESAKSEQWSHGAYNILGKEASSDDESIPYIFTSDSGHKPNDAKAQDDGEENERIGSGISMCIIPLSPGHEECEAEALAGGHVMKTNESSLDTCIVSSQDSGTTDIALKPSNIGIISALDDDVGKKESFGRNRSRRCWAYLITIAVAIVLIAVLIPTTLLLKNDGEEVHGSSDAAANITDDGLSSQTDSLDPSNTTLQPTENTTAPTAMPSIGNIFNLAPPALTTQPTSNSPTRPSTDTSVLNDTSNINGTITSSTIEESLELIEVDNILSRVRQPLESSYGCHYTGPQEGGTNLFDNVISDFMCPPAQVGDPWYGDNILPSFIFNTGPSIVTGIRVFAATNCFGCDPISFSLKGYNSNDSSWKLIASGPFDDDWSKAGIDGPPPRRNPKFASTLGSSAHCSLSTGSVDFNAFQNFEPLIYSRYSLQFPDLRYGSNPYNHGYNLWLGELQLVGALVV